MESNVNHLELNTDVTLFLRDHAPNCSECVTWLGGQIDLELTTFVTTDAPPDTLITSGKCIVMSDSSVLVMNNPGGSHILPGGRREPGESPLSAAIREVAEETGLAIPPPAQLAVLVYRHLTPMPVLYRYPYPVFMNLVYVVRTLGRTQLTVNDSYELAGEFVSLHDSRIQALPIHQQVLLAAALKERRA